MALVFGTLNAFGLLINAPAPVTIENDRVAPAAALASRPAVESTLLFPSTLIAETRTVVTDLSSLLDDEADLQTAKDKALDAKASIIIHEQFTSKCSHASSS